MALRKLHDDRLATSAPRILGCWEWVALPEFGISCMKAQLAPEVNRSQIAGDELQEVELDEGPGLQFRIFPLVGDESTFVLAEAPLTSNAADPCRPRVRTQLTIANQTDPVELELVPRCAGSTTLVLGKSALGDHTVVDPGAETLAGIPGPQPQRGVRP